MTWVFLIPIRTARGGNNREHHMARARRVNAERFATASLIRSTMAQQRARMPQLPVAVTLTREGPGELDDDNLRGSLKAIRDEVAAWLKTDDRDPHIKWDYAQRSRKTWGVNITVQEVQS